MGFGLPQFFFDFWGKNLWKSVDNIRLIVYNNRCKGEYEYVGIRVQEQEFELGEITHKSHNWGYNDNYETVDFGEELDGICCTRLEEAEKSEYFGDHIAVICGNHATFGEDDGEIIIEDPVVVKIIR